MTRVRPAAASLPRLPLHERVPRFASRANLAFATAAKNRCNIGMAPALRGENRQNQTAGQLAQSISLFDEALANYSNAARLFGHDAGNYCATTGAGRAAVLAPFAGADSAKFAANAFLPATNDRGAASKPNTGFSFWSASGTGACHYDSAGSRGAGTVAGPAGCRRPRRSRSAAGGGCRSGEPNFSACCQR